VLSHRLKFYKNYANLTCILFLKLWLRQLYYFGFRIFMLVCGLLIGNVEKFRGQQQHGLYTKFLMNKTTIGKL
jgi:hypothetical protein